MIENFGGIINFLAVLLPAIMALYYGYRCLFASDAFIEQYGLGAASGFMVKLTGTYTITQAIMYFILILTSPTGAWAVFAFGTIQSFLFLIFGYTTVKGPWAEIDGVKASACLLYTSPSPRDATTSRMPSSA